MTTTAYTIRNYVSGDFDRIIHLASEVEELKGASCFTSPHDLIEDFGKPDASLEDNLFVAEIGGNVTSYVQVIPELHIGRVVLKCLFHPKHRKRDLARRIVGCGARRASALGVNRAHVNIPQGNITARRLFARMGFEVVRRFHELRLDPLETQGLKTKQTAFPCRPFKRGEEAKLAYIQNRSFLDTWGFNPNTVEEIVYRTSLPNCSTGDILIAFDSGRPIAFCWTRKSVIAGEPIDGRDQGRIYMLGVDPDYRGRGVGKQVLRAGLSRLKAKGVRSVELTVDSANKAAWALYRSAGFKVCASSLWYEKVLS